MFERRQAIAKRRAEIDPEKYETWLYEQGRLLSGNRFSTPVHVRALTKFTDNTVLGGQLDPDELQQIYQEYWDNTSY